MRRGGLAILILLGALTLAGAPSKAATLPGDFEKIPLITGLTGPTAVDWTPDGRTLIAEKTGRLRVVSASGELAPAPVVDLSDHVNSYGDRGLLGLAVDTDFEQNHYVYLLYVYDTDPVNADGPKSSRLTRIILNPDNTVVDPASPETVLLGKGAQAKCPPPANGSDCIPADGTIHSIGTVRSAPDGTLWVGSGDATLGIPRGSAFRTYNEESYVGKLLHVDRDGHGLPGHPFCPSDTNLSDVCTKIYAKGFRNPFRFTLLPSPAGPVVGDVGELTREEIDLTQAGGNYGWPCYEGTIRTVLYSDRARCKHLYATEGSPEAALPPYYDYAHGSYNRYGAGAIVMGPLAGNTPYPAAYRDGIFFGDYAQGFLKGLGQSGAWPLATDLYGFVDLELVPDGDLGYVSFGDGSVGSGSLMEIRYATDDKTPIAKASVNPAYGAAPLGVHFSAAGSTDPDGGTLSYTWDFGDGSDPETGAEVDHTYDSAGSFVARLTVSDGQRSAHTSLAVFPGDTPPTAKITEAPTTYRDGVRVTLRGEASDPEQGALHGAALNWHVVLHHGNHVHELWNYPGDATSFVPPNNHDADSYLTVVLSATDTAGLADYRALQLGPQTIALNLTSAPEGAPIAYGGAAYTAPRSAAAAIGFATGISASEGFDRGGRHWQFHAWSDGGPRARPFTVPASDTTLRAIYTPCLGAHLRLHPQSLGKLRIGDSHAAVVADLGRPARSVGHALRYCVSGGGHVDLAFSDGHGLRLIRTDAPGYQLSGMKVGQSMSRLLKTHPGLIDLGGGIYSFGDPSDPRLLLTAHGVVRTLGVTTFRLRADPARLQVFLDRLRELTGSQAHGASAP